jgi:hypothetical protein
MLQSGTSVVLWISAEAARLFLALQRPKGEVSRWAIIGTVDREQAGVGVWLAITRLEERRENEVTRSGRFVHRSASFVGISSSRLNS